MGLIINQPSEMSLLDLMHRLDIGPSAPVAKTLSPDSKSAFNMVLQGGPVSREQAFVLHSTERGYQQSVPLEGNTMLTTDRQVLDDIAQGDGPKHFLVAMGYAGWGAGQLEAEMVDDAWVALSFQPPLALNKLLQLTPEERLGHVAFSAGLDLSRMAGRIGYA